MTDDGSIAGDVVIDPLSSSAKQKAGWGRRRGEKQSAGKKLHKRTLRSSNVRVRGEETYTQMRMPVMPFCVSACTTDLTDDRWP